MPTIDTLSFTRDWVKREGKKQFNDIKMAVENGKSEEMVQNILNEEVPQEIIDAYNQHFSDTLDSLSRESVYLKEEESRSDS
ncbi:hypothetical protein B0H94_12020 [Salsuginibacillus halophilus]|uniref:Uncharacterized protein n=1 Tax=Salsuginibacillus halophilus TaxID=517424 RepID=A0A2P8H501_9BACI|nr:hypothetical protein [Salsuginibacillus halophilus]PSL41274.1 hypothetical protein B0H94_12020 [Salsuginibacillus halophilus]